MVYWFFILTLFILLDIYIDPIQLLHSPQNVYMVQESIDLSLNYVFQINPIP